MSNGRRVVLAGSILLALCGITHALDIPITVEEPSGVARVAEPASGGVPMPWGELKADTPFALFDGEKEIPLQAIPMVIDEKGMLRWVLLDFQVDLKPKEKKTFTLRTVKPTATPAKALNAKADAGGASVDTGAAAFTVAADKPFSLLTSAAAGKPVLAGGEVSYTDGFDGKRYVADKPTSVTLDYAGPLRTTVCVKGRFVGDDANRFQYIARITAWAGKSYVHVKYSLANSNADTYCFRQVKDSTIALKLAAAPAAAVLGASKPLDLKGDGWMQQSARSIKVAIHKNDTLKWATWYHGSTQPDACVAMAGTDKLWGSAPAIALPNPPGAVKATDLSEGWVAAKAGAGNVFVTDLYFVEDPPRKLAVAKDTILLTGVTEPLEGTEKLPFAQKTRLLFDCSHLSSQYVIDLAAPADNAAMSAQSKLARARLHAMADPAWYFQTGQLPVGQFGTQADELACYKQWGWKYDENAIPKAPSDIVGRIQRWTCGDDNHFTSEQDTTEALLLMYLRTGGRGFFEAGESWVNYFMDLQTWRTDGWRWKDGGVWWHGGPLGSSPQRAEDPVTGLRQGMPAEWTNEMKTKLGVWGRGMCKDMSFHFLAKECTCHNWGEGLVEWYMITGDRDAYEAAIDTVEQNYDTQVRAFGKVPGKDLGFSRDFTRSCYLTNATRLVAPTDDFVVKASDQLAAAFFGRTVKETRGFVNGPHPVRMALKGKGGLEDMVGPQGVAALEKAGVTWDAKAGQLADPKTGAKWYPLVEPHTWMYPPLSRAMETYYRITGSEDAQDWVIAYGQAVAYVLFQPKHGNLSYGRCLADFPQKGVCKDWASWVLPDDCTNGEGNDTVTGQPVGINGYLGQFYPDVPARGYWLSGEPFLKQRAFDFWSWSSRRGYGATKQSDMAAVGMWVNCFSTHSESVCYTGRTFWEWAHPRKDEKAPAAVADLKVALDGDKATVTFTAPADEGGKVARYQVKCSDKPIVDYVAFLKKFAANDEAAVTNFWMAANVAGEPAPGVAGAKESFTVTAPKDANYFAVVSFDDSSNRSAMSNVAEAGK
ncbi:MAG: hypothetical protein PHU85_08735 [Phycisphaerae bacterium]|nr:hypothetical protein [Phycisphaerae bacterium]